MHKDLKIQYEKELIFEICCTAKGVGKTTAGAAAEFFSSVEDFLGADEKELRAIKNSKKKSVLSETQIGTILLAKAEIVQGKSVSETWLFFLAKSFIRAQVKNLEDMLFNDLDVNPLLAKALDLNDPREIIRFNMYQHVTRSIVTSWGSTVEKMLKYSGCELEQVKIGIKGREPDLVKKVGKKVYCLQIKSGPNTMNVDMVESLNKVMQELDNKGYIGLLGMSYGKREKISQQILRGLKDSSSKTKIGRELWDFISEIQDYHKSVIEVIEEATKQELRKSFIDLIEGKIEAFREEWKAKYKGLNINAALEDYI